MINNIDWELLSDTDIENRLKNWEGKYMELYPKLPSSYFFAFRLQQLLKNPLFWFIAALQDFWNYWTWVCRYRLYEVKYKNEKDKWSKKNSLKGSIDIRLFFNNEYWIQNYNPPTIHIYFTIPTEFFLLELTVGGEDNEVAIAFGCGLFCVWFSLKRIIPKSLAQKISKYDHHRSTGIQFHDDCFWLNIWRDEHGYADNKGIHKCFHVLDFILGKFEYTSVVLEESTVPLALPERTYFVKVKLEERTFKRSRISKTIKSINCELEPDIAIPIPGKGENYFDCDDDAVHMLSCNKDSVAEAISFLYNNITETRLKYGGSDWIPGE